ncbi:MAG TPA: YdcF family protein [Haliangium sp.]|nr:YdcF family protein [Haliangium sp.]
MILRAIALFLGAFSLLSFLLGLAVPSFDANIWWIDVRMLPAWLEVAALPAVGVSLLAYALLGPLAGWLRWPVALGLGFLAAVVVHNTVLFYVLVVRGMIRTDFPVPLSLLVLVPVVMMVHDAWRGPPAHPWRAVRASDRWLALLTLALLVLAFPVVQMMCFGSTDYSRPADVIVVFGARAYADGRMSTALYDRTRTAVDLYRAGVAPALIFSGGPGDGDVHETEAMRRWALGQGVPDSAIMRDEGGLSTQHTVENTVSRFRKHGFRRVLAVSQFFHLPRIKLAYLRAGVDVYTVPARPSAPLYKLPWFMLREVGGFWYYYLRPLVS